MKKFDDDKLKVGDIILTSDSNRMSRKVRKWTDSDFSHAMVYVAHCSVIDATGDGVHSTNTQRIFFDDESAVVVLRYKGTLSPDSIQKITDYARGQTGTEYSMLEAAAVVTGKLTPKTRRQFCSRLAAQAYSEAGIELVADADYCSPEDLRRSADLEEIADVLLPATDEEKAFWEERPNISRLMAESTNRFLVAVRKKSKSIQALNDVHTHLMNHPEDDGFFKRALEKSGYLTVWREEYDRNRWHYDIDLMREVGNLSEDARGQLTWYCRSTVAGDADGRRYAVNHDGYETMARMTESKTFRLFADLYALLDQLHRKRTIVARAWLDENSIAYDA